MLSGSPKSRSGDHLARTVDTRLGTGWPEMLEVYSPAARASAISYTVLRLPAGWLALAWYRINASCVVIPFASLPTLLPRISRVISR